MVLYVGPEAPDAVLAELFGVPSWSQLPPAHAHLPLAVDDSSRLNTVARGLVGRARERARCYMRLRVALRGRPDDEAAFGALLIEDKARACFSQ
jgi:hypothetical protein